MNASTATRVQLDATRWHFQHGPIDLIIGADGNAAALQAAYEACWQRFVDVLPELVRELKSLKAPLPHTVLACPLKGGVARRMWSACHPHRARYITPMAAVAGSVADELIGAFARPGVSRAFINNGGDIALYLTGAQSYRIGVFADLAEFTGATLTHGQSFDANLTLDASMPGTRYCNERLAGPQLQPRHRRQRHRARAERGGRRCRGDDHRQRGRSRSCGHRAPAGFIVERR